MGFVLYLRILPSKCGVSCTYRDTPLPIQSTEVPGCALSAHIREDFGCCSDKVISWNCICISKLATMWINALLCMAKAFLNAAGILKEMTWHTHSQQLEYLVNTSGYTVHTDIKREGEHLPFFYFEDVVSLFALVGVSSQRQGFFFFFFKLNCSDLCSFVPLWIDSADLGFT